MEKDNEIDTSVILEENNPKWLELHRHRLRIDENRCRNCGRRAEQTKEDRLLVHHWTYEWEKRADLDVHDVVTMCKDCHVSLSETKRRVRYLLRPDVELVEIVHNKTEVKSEKGLELFSGIKGMFSTNNTVGEKK